MTLPIGIKAPEFTLPNQDRQPVSLSDLTGQPAVVVFMPFAFTRVCGSELCQIRDEQRLFTDAGAKVVAITCNSVHANRVWREQEGFPFDILSDWWPHGEVSRRYQTFNEEYGYPERTTYFLDPAGVITSATRSPALGDARDFDAYRAALG